MQTYMYVVCLVVMSVTDPTLYIFDTSTLILQLSFARPTPYSHPDAHSHASMASMGLHNDRTQARTISDE